MLSQILKLLLAAYMVAFISKKLFKLMLKTDNMGERLDLEFGDWLPLP